MGNIRDEVQKEILDSLDIPCHGLLNIAPRVGKTKLAISIIKKEKPQSILWVTPNEKLRDVDIPAEFKKWKGLTYLRKTTIICYASLSSHTGKYDKIILDEYQDLTIKSCRPLLKGKIEFTTIVGLSGTHPKQLIKNMLYEKLGLKILYSMNIDEAVEKKLIAPYKITVVECELERELKTVKAGSKTKPFFTTEEKQYTYLTSIIAKKLDNEEVVPKFFYLNRMRFLYNLKSKNNIAKELLKRLGGRTIIFSGSIEKAEEISEYTFHSKRDDKYLELFKQGKINELSLVNSGGVGHTFYNVDNLIIVQVNSNKKGDGTQKIARSLVLQDGYVANIYILVVKNTVDETWKDKVLEDFDLEKVEYVKWEDYE